MSLQPSSPPLALTIAGFDTSGGAGVPADLRTFQLCGCHGLAALTSVVAESPSIVSRVELIDPDFVAHQLKLMLELYPVAAIKTGMLPNAETVRAIAAHLRHASEERQIPLVIDPVMIASTGDELVDSEAVAAMREHLFPLATLITPNLDEAMLLAGERLHDFEEPTELAAHLRHTLGANVLLKGGHFPGATVIDLLALEAGVEVFTAPRIETLASHGTGCTLSAAIAAQLARGEELLAAVEFARAFIRASLNQPMRFQQEANPPQHHLGWPIQSCQSHHPNWTQGHA